MTYDAATIAALQSGELVLRYFLTVHGKTLGGAPKTFCYWTGEDNIAVNLVPPGATAPVSRNAMGGGTLLNVPQIVDGIGFEARTVTFGLDHISKAPDSPMDMVFGHNIRVARVEFHRGVFDPMTWHLVAWPHLVFAGRVDGDVEVEDAPADGEGGLSLPAIGSVIDLTKVNPAMKSDEQQRLRGGDRLRRWSDTMAQQERWWGMAKGDSSGARK